MVMSQWGRVNVRLHRATSNARICEVLRKAADAILPDGYRGIRLILEFSDIAAESDFCVDLQPDSNNSVFEFLVEKEVGLILVQLQPPPPAQPAPVPIRPEPFPNVLARQRISSLYLTNSYLVRRSQELTTAYQQTDSWLRLFQVLFGLVAVIIGIVQVVKMFKLG